MLPIAEALAAARRVIVVATVALLCLDCGATTAPTEPSSQTKLPEYYFSPAATLPDGTPFPAGAVTVTITKINPARNENVYAGRLLSVAWTASLRADTPSPKNIGWHWETYKLDMSFVGSDGVRNWHTTVGDLRPGQTGSSDSAYQYNDKCSQVIKYAVVDVVCWMSPPATVTTIGPIPLNWSRISSEKGGLYSSRRWRSDLLAASLGSFLPPR